MGVIVLPMKNRRLLAPLLLAAATILTYSNSFSAGFTLDSRQAILNDARVHEVSARSLADIFGRTYWWPYDASGLYRPLTTLSYLFNYAVLGNGDRPAGYHWVNLLLHIANVLLVYLLARPWTSYALPAALLWAIHPVLTESVTNIVGRADLLAALGTLAALWFYTERPKFWPVGVAAATTIGVFSKESAVVIPLLLPLFDSNRRRLMVGLAAVVAPIAGMLLARQAVLADALPRSIPFTDNPLVSADFWTAKLTALSVLGRYCWLLVWPARLSADYSWAQIPPASDWAALLTAAAVAGAGLLWRRRALLWAAIAILPTANLLFLTGTIMAERFLYFPSIAFALCLASVWRWRAGRIAVCAIVLTFGARAWFRNRDWHDDRSMAESLIRTSPASFKAHSLLTSELARAHADPALVAAEAEKSLAPLDPLSDAQNSEDTWRVAGEYFASAGRYARSAEVLERCWGIVEARQRLHPDQVYPAAGGVLAMLASDYIALGRLDDAAITLMLGHLTTGDATFRNRILEVYRGIDCAIVPGPSGPAINQGCPPVRSHLCAALLRARKTTELRAYGCKN
jgi:hypothetical protein